MPSRRRPLPRKFFRPALEQLEQRSLLTAFYPGAIRAAYGIDQINFGGTAGTGAGQTIAIVGAATDDNAYLASDLATFDSSHNVNLPAPPSFSIVQVPGTPSNVSDPTKGSEIEEELDIEVAHAMAPGANIVLVEADDTTDDLAGAAQYAAGLPGVSVVSISFGYFSSGRGDSGEYTYESDDDSYFTTPSGHAGVTFVASSGDESYGTYPAFSPNVVAAGGTTLQLTPGGAYSGETYWDTDSLDAGGAGLSQYEAEPAYQDSLQTTGKRSVPDLSFDSNPNTGFWVYTHEGGWSIYGGTSVAAPALASLFAIADQGRALMGAGPLDGRNQTLPALYSLPASDFNAMSTTVDIAGTTVPTTGLGSPKANLLVPDLVSYGLGDRLVITAEPPSSVTAGSSFEVQVAAETSLGRVDTTASGTIDINGIGYATLAGGVATCTVTLTHAQTGATLTLTDGDLSATTTSFSVVPAAASKLVIIDPPPGSIGAGSAFGLIVGAEDAYGNMVSSVTGTVTAAIADNPGRGHLTGSLSESFTGGEAAFPALAIDTAGIGYTLTLSSSHLTSVETGSLNVLTTLTISGSSHDMVQVTFIDRGDYRVTVNGASTVYSTAQYNDLAYTGPAGSVSQLVFNDSYNTYSATQSPADTRLVSSTFEFDASEVSVLTVYGRSSSTANVSLAGSSGGSFFVVDASSRGAYVADPTAGLFSELVGFGSETVSGAPSTYGYLYSVAGAAFLGRASGSTFSTASQRYDLAGLPQLYAVGAAGGGDSLALDSGGGTFVGTPDFSYVNTILSGATYLVGTLYGAQVSAVASSSADAAYFYSYPGDVFTGASGSATLSGSSASSTGGTATFSASASGFYTVGVFESGSGTDTARLTSSGGATLTVTPTVTTLSLGTGSITINTFYAVTSGSSTTFAPLAADIQVSGTSTDTAILNDATGANRLTATGNSATLTTPTSTYAVDGFGQISARASSGTNDVDQLSALDFALATVGSWTAG